MSRRIAVLTLTLFAVAVPASAANAQSTTTPAPTDATPPSITVPLPDGGSVKVSFTAAVGSRPDLAQQYVAYLDSLPHGSELTKLKLIVATPQEVDTDCGGSVDEEGQILGCYDSRNQTMTVPSTGLDTPTQVGQYTVRYVLTHEYGHHIANNRTNDLGAGGALDFGPKYWASYELVCDQTGDRKLFPGDEAGNYLKNPGESWAETYARLTFPEQPWTFTKLLQPDAAALEAARKDVLTPWTRNAGKTFTMPAGRNSESFDLPLTLDGSLKATVKGPGGGKYTVKLTSGSQKVPLEHKAGSPSWTLAVGCREKQTETVTFHLQRSGGHPGPVQLRVSYPG